MTLLDRIKNEMKGCGMFRCTEETPWDGSKDQPVFHEITYINKDGDMCCISCHANFSEMERGDGVETEVVTREEFEENV